MNKFIILMAAAIALCSSCKKNEEAEVLADSTWVLGGVSYKGAITYKTTTSNGNARELYNFWDATPSATVKVNSLALSFVEVPTATGTYQLVQYGTAKTAKQFELAAGTTAPLAYAYLGTAAVDVTVTVSNGKIKVVIPEVTLKCSTSNPDAKLTATLQEK